MVNYTVHHADCLVALRMMADDSIDAIVTDPPYGLAFMGKRWDYDVPGVDVWREALRVLKPGGHLLAFGGTRTYHRMVVNIEDAGFEIRDQVQWVYGSGFPKSHDVSKAIDAAAGAEPIDTGMTKRASIQRNGTGETWERGAFASHPEHTKKVSITQPATPDAERWHGWGTALKPANEPICMARKPLTGTVAENVLAWGTGAINVDGCRVNPGETVQGGGNGKANNGGRFGAHETNGTRPLVQPHDAGRWPANFIHDGSDEVVGLFPVTSSGKLNQASVNADNRIYGRHDGYSDPKEYAQNTGSAARFFYCAKASKAERDAGLDGLELREREGKYGSIQDGRPHTSDGYEYHRQQRTNHHPTVKPIALMRYLCRLITLPGGTVLDPFCGSGTTGIGATLEGFNFVGIEQDAEYVEIAKLRIGNAVAEQAFGLFAEAAD